MTGPLVPGSPEWIARARKVFEEEASEPEQWWYLSFANEEFLGAAFVRARGMAHATVTAHLLGINPGGSVKGAPIPDELMDKHVPEANRNRLMAKHELGDVGRW